MVETELLADLPSWSKGEINMSFGGLGNCPLCWDDPEICTCSQADIDAYYKEIERKRKEMEEFNKANHKHPMQEAWEKYKKDHQ